MTNVNKKKKGWRIFSEEITKEKYPRCNAIVKIKNKKGKIFFLCRKSGFERALRGESWKGKKINECKSCGLKFEILLEIIFIQEKFQFL